MSVKKSMKSLDQHDRGSVRIQVNIKICISIGLFPARKAAEISCEQSLLRSSKTRKIEEDCLYRGNERGREIEEKILP